MLKPLVSGLVIATGLVSAGVGVAAAAGCLRDANRIYRKRERLFETMPDGWSSWFWSGFSGLTIGAQGLRATVALAGWTIAGLCLIGLGLQLF